jgi:hypothetical protein
MAMRKLPTILRLPLAALALLGASSLALSQSPAPTPAPARQPVISDDTLDDFADLNRNLASLQTKISKVKRLLAENQDQNLPASQREAFGRTVAALLDAFADNGEVAQLGQGAVELVRHRLADAQHDANFPPGQKEALVVRWRRLATETETMAASLDATRTALAEKLQLLQSKADFVDQMAKLRQTRALIDAVGDLADQRQAVTRRVRELLQGRPDDAPDM